MSLWKGKGNYFLDRSHTAMTVQSQPELEQAGWCDYAVSSASLEIVTALTLKRESSSPSQ